MTYDDFDAMEARYEERAERDAWNEFGEREGTLPCGHHEGEDCDCCEQEEAS